MGFSNIIDLLTSFSPDLHFFAISSGDGRIKIWDTLKGQIQTEFADFFTSDSTSILTKPEKGHLSVDYKCMKWLSLEKKRKRKRQCSLLLLGTGSGDVLALDVAAGELKWKISDCHPGGVASISFPAHGSWIYTAGADGMLCEIDSLTGNLSRKFKASTKAISCISVSPDGKIIATAASQMKIFNCSNHKKIQKFSGHPGAVRCMVFTEDGRYILSSAVGERYVVVWSLDGGKKQSASCVLAMEHPAIFVDSRRSNDGGDETALYILAISEIGVCYLWYGQNLGELRSAKPTKILISDNDISSKSKNRVTPAIYAAKLQGVPKSGSGQVFLAHGLLVKPSFQNVLVQSGTDINLNSSNEGILLPSQSIGKSKKGLDVQGGVVALDRANAEDALRPIPKVFDSQEKSTLYQDLHIDRNDVMTQLVDSGSQVEDEGGVEDSASVCMEDQLRSLGILHSTDDHTSESILKLAISKGIDLEVNMSQKKLREAVLSLAPGDACKLLGNLVSIWQYRLHSGKNVLPWIYSLLLNHSQHILSQEQSAQILDSLFKITKSKETAVQPLLQLSGRLQLVLAQIERASANKTDQTIQHSLEIDGSESSDDEDEDEVDDVFYGEEENESELSSDDES
ncbi:WD repeat-containing protein 43 [Benincasa hispida]|uniref:WD repeat-containing protein 43 n=1 Tax=Benincasa hispida TaxID=102211 RepID=UPI0018FFFF43|nr:WD repeat-containing protein 43 [Benincasa hispida]XP_038876235.1 WD repeat-containing protein 43 [Benincasa hispida]